jgi:hypothetical protein
MNTAPEFISRFRTHHGCMVLTAKDIAEAIAFKKDKNGFSKALRQVKHWTDRGVLQAITRLDTGSGVAREYVDSPTLVIAAILQELVLFGWTIDKLKPIADLLYDDFENGDPGDVFGAAMTGEFMGYLALEFDVDSRGRLSLETARTFSTHPDAPPLTDSIPKARSSLLLDLRAIVERITWPESEEFEAWLRQVAGRK